MATKKDEATVCVPVEEIRGAKVAQKILQLREKIKTIKATKMSTAGMHYNYLSENELTNALRPVLQELHLVVIPTYTTTDTERFEMGKDKYDKDRLVLLSTVKAVYTVYDTDTGDYLSIESVGAGADSMDKGVNKANTCAFKNMLRALGMFPSPEREDTDFTPSSGSKTASTGDAGGIMIKYGDFKGQTIKDLFDKNPEAVEKMAEGSNWLAGKAKEFLASVA